MTNFWYAILFDNDDTDWGYGTYDRDGAIDRARFAREDYPDAYIAVIDEESGCCVEEIREVL